MSRICPGCGVVIPYIGGLRVTLREKGMFGIGDLRGVLGRRPSAVWRTSEADANRERVRHQESPVRRTFVQGHFRSPPAAHDVFKRMHPNDEADMDRG